MIDGADTLRTDLEPVRAALIARAQAQADRIRAAAEGDGQELLASAREEAARLLSVAREQGQADGAAVLAVERARTHRLARAIVLGAQRDVYDELCRRCRTALRARLREQSVRDQLANALRRRLGGAAVIRGHPDGGLVAEAAGGRSVDGSVGVLVDDALSDLDLDRLWAEE